jgi:RNA ligase
MRVESLLDTDKLAYLIGEGYILQNSHPTLPLRILNYSNKCMFEDKWPYEACVCRGLIVDTDGNVVSRPFPKFFNIGQKGPYLVRDKSTDLIPPGHGLRSEEAVFDAAFLLRKSEAWKSPITITRKLDGWLGILWHYGDQWGIASRGSFESPGAVYATQRFQKFVKYTAVEEIPPATTLLFEIISRETKVVVPYPFEGLVLLAAVDNETGEEMRYAGLEALYGQLNQYAMDHPWCRLVERFDKTVEECMTDDDMEQEGYVATVYRTALPPIKAKVKLAEYCRLHRILTHVTPQKIWAELAYPMSQWTHHNSKRDWEKDEIKHDMLLPKDFTAWVRRWHSELASQFHYRLLLALDALEAVRILRGDAGDEKKEAEAWAAVRGSGRYDQDTLRAATRLSHGKMAEAYEGLWDLVRPHGRQGAFYADGKGE